MSNKDGWYSREEDPWEEEEPLWYCYHGRAYGIKCRRCDEEDDD